MDKDNPTQLKWDEHYKDRQACQPQPCYGLAKYQYLLPGHGQALDLACGLGGNALLLAKKGLQTTAWDYSEQAVATLLRYASEVNLNIQAELHDVEAEPPKVDSFDVIVVSHYLDRGLIPYINDALRPGGWLFYQTFTRDAVGQGGPRNPLYRLAAGELLRLFSGLQPRIYREEGSQGDVTQGLRNEALLVAQKL